MSQVVQTGSVLLPDFCLLSAFQAIWCCSFWIYYFSLIPSGINHFILVSKRQRVHGNPGVFISGGNPHMKGASDYLCWLYLLNYIEPNKIVHLFSLQHDLTAPIRCVTVFMGCWNHSNFSGSDTTWHDFRYFSWNKNDYLAEIKAQSARRKYLVWPDYFIVHCSF